MKWPLAARISSPSPSSRPTTACLPTIPSGERRTNDGPPDLDEILKKLQQKLAGLFGRRAAAPAAHAARPRGPSAAFFGGSIAFVVLLILAVWLASGFYIVDEGRRGVVLRLGKYIETTMPGPALAHPVPDRVASRW